MNKKSVWKKRTSTWQSNHSMTEHLIAKLQEYENGMDYQNNVNTNDDSDDCMVRPPFSSLTSSYQPFQTSEKGSDPGQPRLTQSSPSPGSCKRKIRR